MSTKIQIVVPRWLLIHIPKTGGTFFKNSVWGWKRSVHIPGFEPMTPLEKLVQQTIQCDIEVSNEGHAFPYHFTVDGWNPQASKYALMPHLKNMQYHRVYNPDYTPDTDNLDYVTIVRNPFSLFYSYWR